MGFTKFNVFLVADGHNCSNYKPEINFQVLVIRAFLLQLAAGGFMLGGMLGSGNSLETFMQKPLAIPTLIITIIVLVPAGYFLARRLFKTSFGNHLEVLQENIKDMENEY